MPHKRPLRRSWFQIVLQIMFLLWRQQPIVVRVLAKLSHEPYLSPDCGEHFVELHRAQRARPVSVQRPVWVPAPEDARFARDLVARPSELTTHAVSNCDD